MTDSCFLLARNNVQGAHENTIESLVMETGPLRQKGDQVSFTKTIVQAQIEDEQVKQMYEEHARILQNYSAIKISVSKSCETDQC